MKKVLHYGYIFMTVLFVIGISWELYNILKYLVYTVAGEISWGFTKVFLVPWLKSLCRNTCALAIFIGLLHYEK